MSDCGCPSEETEGLERKTLRVLLGINAAMFVFEGVVGWWAESTGLLADALDMLADAAVYGAALYVVGGSKRHQAAAASGSGVVQIALGIGVLVEVFRRFAYGSSPEGLLMSVVGGLALVANVTCLVLMAKHREGGVHMRASWIFSANDVIANVGVIVSGLLVVALGTRVPDLVVGAVISAVVVRGGWRILREADEVRRAEGRSARAVR